MKKALIYLDKINKQLQIETIKQFSDSILANYEDCLLIESDDKNLDILKKQGFSIRIIPNQQVVEVGNYKVNTAANMIKSDSISAAKMGTAGVNHYILQLKGPMHPEWKRQLEQIGIAFRQSLSQENYYLISIHIDNVGKALQLPFVESIVPYYPSLKINPNLLTQEIHLAMDNAPTVTPIDPSFTAKNKINETKLSGSELSENTNTLEIISNQQNINRKIDMEKEGNLELLLFDQKDQQSVIESILKHR